MFNKKLAYYCNNNLSLEEEYEDIFDKKLPEGKMFCPFHDNKNTPAAKRYGNFIKCFSCGKTYGVYDLLYEFNPGRLAQIELSINLDAIEIRERKQKYRKFHIRDIDRSRSMLAILLDLRGSFEEDTE